MENGIPGPIVLQVRGFFYQIFKEMGMRSLGAMAVIPLLLVLFVATPLSAELTSDEGFEEIVVVATRLETPRQQVGSSVTVISEDELAKTGKTLLHDALRAVPGLDVVRRGGEGQQTSIFIRGANSEHTLVLIDGMEANDPISPNRSFDFANIAIENIERVEVIRGPQSNLYGSDAIGGVINIITKRGRGKPTVTAFGEYGSFETRRGGLAMRGGKRNVHYSISLSKFETDGISSAAISDGNSERDGYENSTVAARLGVNPLANVEIEITGRYIEADVEIDRFDGDDPNSLQETEQLFLRGRTKFSLFGGSWENMVGLGLSKTERENVDDPDVLRPSDSVRSAFRGELVKGDWQANLELFEGNLLIFGAEAQEERGESNFFSISMFGPFSSVFEEQVARTEGYFIEDQMRLWDVLFITAGGRVDHHSRFGSEFTYRLTGSYTREGIGTRVKGTFGTGFKAPSLFQLFDPASGNPDLQPEKSEGWDVGVEQDFAGGRVRTGITYFRNEITNLIDFIITNPLTNEGTLINIGKSRSEGIELFTALDVLKQMTIVVNYTYNDARDEDSDEFLLKRARNRVTLFFGYDLAGRGSVNATVAYTGERQDIFTDPNTFVTERVVLGGYTIVNMAASYDVGRGITIFSRVDNLFDKEYEESKGFGTQGISGYFGVRAAM